MKRTLLLLSFALLGGTATDASATTLAFFFNNQPATLANGVASFQRGDYGAAVNNFERYAQSFPQDPEAAYWLAKCYEMTIDPGKTNQALKRYQELTVQQEQMFSFIKETDASTVYAAQLKLDPSYHKARVLYAIALLREGNTEKAKFEGEKLLELPATEEYKAIRKPMLTLLGEIDLNDKRIDSAKERFKAALQLGGNTTYLRKKIKEADELVDEGVLDEKALQQFQSMVTLANDLFNQNNLKGALEAIEQALAIVPEDAPARQLRGKILGCQKSQELYKEAETAFRNKEIDAAANFAKQALDFNPENVLAAELLTHIQREKSKAQN